MGKVGRFRVRELKQKPGWYDKTLEQVAELGGEGYFHHLIQHDSWCLTLATGRGADCNCDPDVICTKVDTLEEAVYGPKPKRVD